MLYDLCVIGGGMYGSAAARHASANPTLKVILIGPDEPNEEEFGTREIFGSHYDEGRITRILDEQVCHQVLAKKSIQRYRELEKLSDIDFYQPVGFLCIAKMNSPCMKEIKRSAAMGNVPILEMSDTDMETRFSYLQIEEDEAAVFEDVGAGHISPRKLVAAQKKVAQMQGCVIMNDIVEEVTALEENEKGNFHKVITEKKKIINAKRVLISTGAFTNFKSLIPKISSNPSISVNKETAILLQISETEAKRLETMPSMCYYKSENLIEDTIGAYILPPIKYPDNHYYLKIGHMNMPSGSLQTLDAVKKWYLGEGDPEVEKELPKWMEKMLPGLKILKTKVVTCVSCSSPTHLPYIERITPTISVAIVGNGCGAKFSDEIGRLAAKLCIYAEWDSNLPKSVFNVVWTDK